MIFVSMLSEMNMTEKYDTIFFAPIFAAYWPVSATNVMDEHLWYIYQFAAFSVNSLSEIMFYIIF